MKKTFLFTLLLLTWLSGLFLPACQTMPVQTPSARGYTRMVYDNNRQVLVLWGGKDRDGLPNDTWEYDGKEWQQVETLASPPGRVEFAMAYDVARQVVVICCGANYAGFQSETLEYGSGTWREGVKLNSDPDPALVYDGRRRTLIFFVRTVRGGETFSYDGERWQRLTDILNVTPDRSSLHNLVRAQMVYDSKRQLIVLHSGMGVTVELYEDTWQQRGEWGSGPQGSGFGLAYDTRRGVTVLFGQFRGSRNENFEFVGHPLNETWEYDGRQWLQVTPKQSPPARYHHAMAYDEARGVTVVFGGIDANENFLNDTWEYDGVTWVQK
jgi:hypothetical protein